MEVKKDRGSRLEERERERERERKLFRKRGS